jgi:putative flavoprotein involved in K+ transport
MATAACLQREGVEFDLIDRRGECGGAYPHIYAGLQLLSPARYTQLPGLPIRNGRSRGGEYVTVPQYREYLAEYARHFQLQPAAREVRSIERAVSGFDVRFTDSDQPTQYSSVVVATGMFDAPFIPPIEGITSTTSEKLHSRDWPGPVRFSGKRVLVIGGGMSGVEIAEECVRAGLPVTISSRHPIRAVRRRLFGIDIHHFVHAVSHWLPLWTLGSFCDRLPAFPAFDQGIRRMLASNQVNLRGEVRRFDQRVAEFIDGSREEFDVVVLATGYRFHTPFLNIAIERGSRGQPLINKNQSRNCPNLFFVGFPCARIFPSEFLRGIAFDAPFVARHIARRK